MNDFAGSLLLGPRGRSTDRYLEEHDAASRGYVSSREWGYVSAAPPSSLKPYQYPRHSSRGIRCCERHPRSHKHVAPGSTQKSVQAGYAAPTSDHDLSGESINVRYL